MRISCSTSQSHRISFTSLYITMSPEIQVLHFDCQQGHSSPWNFSSYEVDYCWVWREIDKWYRERLPKVTIKYLEEMVLKSFYKLMGLWWEVWAQWDFNGDEENSDVILDWLEACKAHKLKQMRHFTHHRNAYCSLLLLRISLILDTEIQSQAYNSRTHPWGSHTGWRSIQWCQTIANYFGDSEMVWPRQDEFQWFKDRRSGWGLLCQSSSLVVSWSNKLHGYSWCWKEGTESDNLSKVGE